MHSKLKKAASAAVAALTAAVSLTSAVPAAVVTAADTYTEFPFFIEGEDLEGSVLDPNTQKPWVDVYGDKISGDYTGEGFAYLQGNTMSVTVNVPEEAMYEVKVRAANLSKGDANNGSLKMETIAVNGIEYSKYIDYSPEWIDFSFGSVRLKAGENKIEFLGSKYGYYEIDNVTIDHPNYPDLNKATDKLSDPDATPEAQAVMKYLKSVYGEHILSGQQQIYGGGNGVDTTIRYDESSDKCVDSDGKEYTIDKDSYDTDKDGHKFPWHCMDETGFVYTYSTQNHCYSYNYYNKDVDLVYDITGKYPAIQGFDFGSYCPCYRWDDGVAGRMIEWTNDKGGICTASWHVNVPTTAADYSYVEVKAKDITEKDGVKYFKNADDEELKLEDYSYVEIGDEIFIGMPLDFSKTTYSEKTDFSPSKCLEEGTFENKYFQLCVKYLAGEISKLQDAGVPLIFRPFHEAEGNGGKDGKGAWFWWAKDGADTYNQLWKLLYTTLTEEYGLHNLIWEQNLYAWSDDSALWYTGDEYVDIVGFDKYNSRYNRHDGQEYGVPNLDAESSIFWSLQGYVDGNKMVSMPENDCTPSLANLEVENARWLYFCPWYDTDQDPFVTGEQYQDPDAFKELYNSEYCITLDELPSDLFSNSSSEGKTTTTTTKPAGTTTTTATTTVSGSGEGKATILGDATCDGEIKLNDAVLIMQALANPNKFGITGTDELHISEDGWANADCNNPGDGVSGKDALSIQKFMLKLIDTLPEEE